MSWVRTSVFGLLLCSVEVFPMHAQPTPNDPAPVVRALFAAIDAGNLTRAGQLLHDSLRLHYNGVPDPIPKTNVLKVIRAYYVAFPDNVHDIQQLLPSGDHVTVRIMQQATHRGTHEGVPPTGRTVKVGAIHILRVVDGKVLEWWAAEDDLGLLRQIGMSIMPPRS